MPMYVRWILITGPPAQVRDAARAHREHVDALAEQGRIRYRGELTDEEGFLEIFAADDRKHAEATAAESPLVEQGLGSWSVREIRDRPSDRSP